MNTRTFSLVHTCSNKMNPDAWCVRWPDVKVICCMAVINEHLQVLDELILTILVRKLSQYFLPTCKRIFPHKTVLFNNNWRLLRQQLLITQYSPSLYIGNLLLLKGHSQLAQMRIRYHFIYYLHTTKSLSILFLTKYDINGIVGWVLLNDLNSSKALRRLKRVSRCTLISGWGELFQSDRRRKLVSRSALYKRLTVSLN